MISAKVDRNLLESLGIDPAPEDLVRGQFLDQISFTREPRVRVPPPADPHRGLHESQLQVRPRRSAPKSGSSD